MDAAVIAGVFALLAAVVHAYIFVLETLRWEHPATRQVFGTTAEQAAASKQLAANQSVYNLMVGIAAAVGAVLVLGDNDDVGLGILLTATGIMLGAALYLVGTDASKARAASIQGLFPLLAVVAGVIALV